MFENKQTCDYLTRICSIYNHIRSTTNPSQTIFYPEEFNHPHLPTTLTHLPHKKAEPPDSASQTITFVRNSTPLLNLLAPILPILPILSLINHTRLQNLHRVPNPGRDHTPEPSGRRIQHHPVNFPETPIPQYILSIHPPLKPVTKPLLFIKNLGQLPLQQQHILRTVRMPMNRNPRPRQKRIEHPLAPIRPRRPQIQILPQPHTRPSFRQQFPN